MRYTNCELFHISMLTQPLSLSPLQLYRVWDDLNGNGIQDEGEPGLPGVTVSLRDENGDVIATTETNSQGFYRFVDLKPGTYGVHFALPQDYTFAPQAEILFGEEGSFINDINSDADVNTGATGFIDVISGEINLSLDAGVYQLASVEGVAWHDLNANGIRESDEPGMDGVVIILRNINEDGIIHMATTDSSGSYAIEDLTPGTTYFGEILQLGDYFLSPMNAQGSTEQTDSDFDQNLLAAPVTLQGGEVNSGNFDAGVWTYASVGDLIWFDTNGDGLQLETPLVGFPFPVEIKLYDGTTGQFLNATQNDENGFYTFGNLVPGSYELEFTILEEDEVFSPHNQGQDDELDSDVDPETGRVQVYLVSGESNTSVDAGIIADAPYYPDW